MHHQFAYIESRQNSRFRHWLAIVGQGRGRKTEQILLEGLRLCREAVASGVFIETIIVAADAAPEILQFAAGLPEVVARVRVPDKLFALLSDTETPQGVALVCHSPVFDGPSAAASPDGLYLVADGVADPGNLGTMIRTADAFAFSAVLVTAGTVWPMNPKVVRAAMGACFHLPIIRFACIRDVAAWLTASGVPLVAADPRGDQLVTSLKAGGTALLIGNEAHGLSKSACRVADRLIRIPMPGRAESLNAATAASICAYVMMQVNTDARKISQGHVAGDCSDVKRF